MNPAVSRLGGVPIRVAMPPIEAPYATIRSAPLMKPGVAPGAARRARTAPMAIGVIKAAVAVFERQVEIRAEDPPIPSRRPSGLAAKRPVPRSREATRRSRPYFLNASAKRKLPTNRKMTGSA